MTQTQTVPVMTKRPAHTTWRARRRPVPPIQGGSHERYFLHLKRSADSCSVCPIIWCIWSRFAMHS